MVEADIASMHDGRIHAAGSTLRLQRNGDGAAEGYSDQIAERIVQFGGIAEGSVRAVAAKTQLIDYPLALSSGGEHVAALSDSLSGFGRTTRMGIEEMDDLVETVSADLLTEITRGADK